MTDQSARLAASVSHISLMHRPYGPPIHLSEEAASAPVGGEAIAADLPADAPEEFSSVHDAAAYFNGLQEKRKNPPAESAETATAENESPVEGDAAADENQPTGETEEVDPAEKPPLELPRSWTKEQAEHWKALPRETQEYLTERASKDSEAIRKVQNDAAEKLKGLTAKEQQVEQVRQQYEAKVSLALQALEREQRRDFPDIKTWEDVKNLQRNDPFRYQEWDVHQKELALVKAEDDAAKARQSQEHITNWNTHVQAENARAAELIPELADKVKGPALMTRAAERLVELGFKPEELNDLASGKQKLSIYDHRLQQLIFSDLKLSDIQSAKTAVAAKPLPPVQRPGASKPLGQNANSERIQALNRKPELTVREATELVTLQQSSQRRAS